jgi:YaiO family outer membrane protein
MTTPLTTRSNRASRARFWLACWIGSASTLVGAQSTPTPGLQQAEMYTTQDSLSGNYGSWREVGVRGLYRVGPQLWSGELASMERFNEKGNYLGLGNTLVFDPHWFGSLSVGAGDGAAYLPRYRVDGFIHRKWLSDLSLITSLGLGHYRSPLDYTDDKLSLGVTAYLPATWVLQAEARINRSNPGRIDTQQYFVAATWGQAGQTRLTGRHGWGEEGYQTLGSDTLVSRFSSHQTTLSAQHWLGPDWGLKGRIENYKNPFYKRDGLYIGVFKEWP